MNPVGRSWRIVACGTVLALGCTDNPFRDPSCVPSGGDPNPVATLATLSLFREDGTPIELPDAVVSCSQGASAVERAQYRPEFGKGAVLMDGGLFVSTPDGTTLNVYTCGIAIILRRCAAPLRVQVDAPGCEHYERTWTWDDNYALSGSNQNFVVPVRLRCTGDAGLGPTMRDIPALNRDSGVVLRDAPDPSDTASR